MSSCQLKHRYRKHLCVILNQHHILSFNLDDLLPAAVNCNPASSLGYSTPKDSSSVITTVTEFTGFYDPFLINTACLLLLYNGKIINSWTLAKRVIGPHYLWSLSLIIYPTYSIVSFPCNKQALPSQIAPSTLHQGPRKLSTKHDTVPTCLAHLVLIKPERPKVAMQRLWLRAKYVLFQIGHRVHFFLSEFFPLCLCCGIFHRVFQHLLKYLILNAIGLLFTLLSHQFVKGKYLLNAEKMPLKGKRRSLTKCVCSLSWLHILDLVHSLSNPWLWVRHLSGLGLLKRLAIWALRTLMNVVGDGMWV